MLPPMMVIYTASTIKSQPPYQERFHENKEIFMHKTVMNFSSKHVKFVLVLVFSTRLQAILTCRKGTSSNFCMLSIASIAVHGILGNHGIAFTHRFNCSIFVIYKNGQARLRKLAIS